MRTCSQTANFLAKGAQDNIFWQERSINIIINMQYIQKTGARTTQYIAVNKHYSSRYIMLPLSLPLTTIMITIQNITRIKMSWGQQNSITVESSHTFCCDVACHSQLISNEINCKLFLFLIFVIYLLQPYSVVYSKLGPGYADTSTVCICGGMGRKKSQKYLSLHVPVTGI